MVTYASCVCVLYLIGDSMIKYESSLIKYKDFLKCGDDIWIEGVLTSFKCWENDRVIVGENETSFPMYTIDKIDVTAKLRYDHQYKVSKKKINIKKK